MPSNPLPTSTPPQLALDLAGVARAIGISKETAKAWRRDGRLLGPTLEAGRVMRWSLREVRLWLEANAPPRCRWQHMRAAALREREGRP